MRLLPLLLLVLGFGLAVFLVSYYVLASSALFSSLGLGPPSAHPVHPPSAPAVPSAPALPFDSPPSGNFTFAGLHATTLTHVVFIVSSQLDADELLATFQTDWQAVSPCAHWDELMRCTPTAKPHLLIVIQTGETALDTTRLAEEIRLSRAIATCFQPWPRVVRFPVQLHSERTPYSVTELLLNGDCGVEAYASEVGYGLFLPVTARAARLGWLSYVAKSILPPAPLYWVVLPFQSRFPLVDRNPIILYRLSKHRTGNHRVAAGVALSCGPHLTQTLAPVEHHSLPHVYFERIRPQGRQVLNRKWPQSDFGFNVQDVLHAFLYYHFRDMYDIVRTELASKVLVTGLFASEQGLGENTTTVLIGGGSGATKSPVPSHAAAYALHRLHPFLYPPPPAKTAAPTLPPTPVGTLPFSEYNWKSSPGYHESWLSHVVFALPNVPSQFERLKHTLRVWWSQFPPCDSEADYEQLGAWQANTCAGAGQSTAPKPTLVFMVSRRSFLELELESKAYDLLLREKIQSEVLPLLSSESTRCFAKVEICVVRFHQNIDNYLTGSRILFERFINGECTGRRGDHALYIEPDARPVRRGWLTSLSTTIIFPNPQSWIVGAIFRGDPQIAQNVHFPPSWFFHFNGNGIYQVRGDSSPVADVAAAAVSPVAALDFPNHYFTKIRPWVERTISGETAMDMDILGYLFAVYRAERHHFEWGMGRARFAQLERDSQNSGESIAYPAVKKRDHLPQVVARFVAHSRFTDMISNQYKTHWTLAGMRAQESGAQIVHGGFCGADCQ